MEVSSPFEDQGVCLAPAMMAIDDKMPTAAYGTGCSSGMPVVRQGSGELLAFILCLAFGPNSVVGDRRRLPRGDLRGGILAVSRWRNIPS